MFLGTELIEIGSNGGDSPSTDVTVNAKAKTEALKSYIASMHAEGHPDSAISARFGCNRSYIAHLRSKMGLKPNRGLATPRFPEDMDTNILRLFDEDNLSWAEIGRQVGRPAREVAERYNFLDQRRCEAEGGRPVVTKTRKCLSCSTPFESTGAGNRLCGLCGERNSSYGNYVNYGNPKGHGDVD